MEKVEFQFVNELGNTILITVTRDQRGITIFASGPTSEVEHAWTPNEARAIRDLLNVFID